MTHHVFARQALYDRVWAEPMRTVAQSLGVSDVGLAKACRAAAIPVPPRGYWAKLQHGKLLPARPSLPGRPSGPDRVVISSSVPKPPTSPAVRAVVTAVAEGPAIRIDDDLRRPHRIVRSWVEDNAQRRREARQRGWGAGFVEDLCAPLAQRRLRLINALLKALEARKLVVGHGRDGLTVQSGGETLSFAVYERNKVEPRPATTDELRWQPTRTTVRATVPAGDLVLKIRERLSVSTEFKELKTPLDAQLAAVVASLEVGLVELAERRRLHALEAERWATAERARKKHAAYREAEAALGERLVQQAERHQRAEAIRAYIAAADCTPAADAADYAAWREWALGRADTMDPLLDGSAPFNRLPVLEDWVWRGW